MFVLHGAVIDQVISSVGDTEHLKLQMVKAIAIAMKWKPKGFW